MPLGCDHGDGAAGEDAFDTGARRQVFECRGTGHADI
jgi:hypothetical protein